MQGNEKLYSALGNTRRWCKEEVGMNVHVCVPLNNVGIVKEQQQGEDMQIDVDVSILLVIL